MKSLWLANIANIILCPIFINGFGTIPAFGLTGAAIATTIGRGLGVCYQLYYLFNGEGALKMLLSYLNPLAYLLAKHLHMGPNGVFIAIPVAETIITLAGYILFKRGKWKRVMV